MKGLYLYLCSGSIEVFPTATSVVLGASTLQVFGGAVLLATVPRKTLWFSSEMASSPSPS